jgi:hypothetical protein
LISRNYRSYVLGYVPSVLKQLVKPPIQTPYIGDQFTTMVQLVISRDRDLFNNKLLFQYQTPILVNTGLLAHVPRVSTTHQPMPTWNSTCSHLC